jgi:hypothetical protein
MRFMPKSMARLRRWVRATRRWEKCFFDAARKKNGQTSVSPISSYVRIPQSGGGEEKNGAPSLIIHIAMALANASCCSASPGLPGRRKTTVTPDVAERVVVQPPALPPAPPPLPGSAGAPAATSLE